MAAKGVNKRCARCGNEFYRPPDISANQWESRKFCSKKCSGMKHNIDIGLIITD